MIFKGSLCKEELLELLDKTDWGNPASNGKHYRNFDGEVMLIPDEKGFNVRLYWRQTPDMWGKEEPESFLKFRTLEVYKSYMEQIKSYREKSKHLNTNNNAIKKTDIYG